MAGPHGHLRAKRKPKDVKKTVKRILSYMENYRPQLIVVVFAIVVSAAAGVAGTYFLKPLINQYIVPFIGKESPDLSGFIAMLSLM